MAVMRINVEGKKESERPKTRWLDTVIESDMRAAGVCVGDVENREKWKFTTSVANP